MNAKEPFDIDLALERIEQAVRPFPKAALFELADDGFADPFQQLVACLISIRTRDETTLPVARRLLARAATAEALCRLSIAEIQALLEGCSFPEAKAPQLAAIARRVVEEHDGVLPCDSAVLRSFVGVGPKCANLVLGIACGQAFIGVDIHVHRVTNRWGYVTASTPERTMTALEAVLPQRHWVEINRLLVPFGKHICTGSAPRCSSCPVLANCRQVGVTTHR